ncbi:DUF2817 domain-containing protein [Thiomicrorhabdus sp.]|uniref:DUF2817 domain-containing protein n=1 Tax=Thiomicrorhabdus sp. TaxID=2039724 RepID=UPI002AA8B491|nr:DUF2817 domain-containing protein [Thiomicrorhabdus sp.]
MLSKTFWLFILATYQACFFYASAATQSNSQLPITIDKQSNTNQAIKSYCRDLSKKLRTVKYKGCLELGLKPTGFKSVQGRILTERHFKPDRKFKDLPKGRILFISGIHGDEYSAISMTYLWMQNMVNNQDQTRQHWLFFPLVNPDGLFRNPATRINADNVDLNRNFPSPDWDELAIDYWKKYYKKNKRRYPGPAANSEPETQWLVRTIQEFKPDAIISIHAPYGLLDYDGPDHAVPNKIGGLKHRELGTYPGSLGRYAGEYLNIPVLTLELRSAGSMPSQKEIFTMWQDVEKWTMTKIQGLDDKTVQQAYNKTNPVPKGMTQN